MPRDERRPVIFGYHAKQRLAERGIRPEDAEWVVRAGAVRPDADCDFIAFGSVAGRPIQCACLDRGDHILVKTAY